MGKTAHFEIFPLAQNQYESSKKVWYFHLVGANGEIMFGSEPYTTQQHAQRAIDRLRDAVGAAEVKVLEGAE